jgi:uncharacterized protein (DUF433 family)
MQLEDYLDFFERPYAIRLKGRRIGLEHIIDRYKQGQRAEEIASYFGDVPVESVYAAITYYLHNQATVDVYLSAIEQRTRQEMALADAHPSPVAQHMRAVKEQWRREGRLAREDPLPAR